MPEISLLTRSGITDTWKNDLVRQSGVFQCPLMDKEMHIADPQGYIVTYLADYEGLGDAIKQVTSHGYGYFTIVLDHGDEVWQVLLDSDEYGVILSVDEVTGVDIEETIQNSDRITNSWMSVIEVSPKVNCQIIIKQPVHGIAFGSTAAQEQLARDAKYQAALKAKDELEIWQCVSCGEWNIESYSAELGDKFQHCKTGDCEHARIANESVDAAVASMEAEEDRKKAGLHESPCDV